MRSCQTHTQPVQTVRLVADLTETIVLRHIKASGPVTFPSIVLYCRMQHPAMPEIHEIAATITDLIRRGKVELYDDGVSFI